MDASTVKTALHGRWAELFASYGIPVDVLDGKHHPCPKCGGKDRFRFIDAEQGALFCNQCFNRGNGDGLAGLQWWLGCDFPEAVRLAAEFAGLTENKPRKPSGGNGKVKPNDPVFAKANDALQELKRRFGPPSAKWTYQDANGHPVGLVCRWDRAGGKEIRPISRCPDGWRIAAMPEPRPLYNLPAVLKADPETTVWGVEGEKCCDVLASLGLLAVTSAGGANAAGKTDWSPLRGRRVIIAADNDEPGRRYADEVAQLCLAAGAKDVRLFDITKYWPDCPEGGDIADMLEATEGVPWGDTAERSDIARWFQETAESIAPWTPKPPDNNGTTANGHRPQTSQAAMLISLVAHAELFHAPGSDGDTEGYVTVRVGNHKETMPVHSCGFRRWLSAKYYKSTEKPPHAQALQDAVNVLAAQALYDGPEIPVAVRVAEHAGAIYLDLADKDWRAVEITAKGWRIVSDSPVRFIRRRGMLPLPEPVKGGDVNELRELVNVPDDDAWRLLVAWLVAALRPGYPFPILVVNGEQGSAKSTLCRMVRALIDPNQAPLRRPPRDVRDLMIAANNAWIIALDNLSQVPPELSDALCCVATGGGFATRELYTDAEEKLFSAMRPIVINGIPDLATRGDLLDRAIVLTLPAIPDEARKEERQLWTRFAEIHPRVLGALLDAVAMALANIDTVTLAHKPRMADFATWVVAAERALNWRSGAFRTAYDGNRTAANTALLDDSPLVQPILALLARESHWQGTATELLNELETLTDEKVRKRDNWPGTPRKLSGDIRRLAPYLRRGLQVEVRFVRENGTGRRLVRLEKG